MNLLVDARFWIMSALAMGLIIGDTGHAPLIITISLIVLMCISLQGLTFSKKDITDNRKEVLIGVFIC